MKKKLMHVWRVNPLTQKILLIMRLTLFLMVLSVFSAFSSSYAQKTKLNLKFQNSQIKDVLNEIENQSEFFFMYDNKQIDVERRVSLEVNSLNIDQTLQKLFEGTGTSFKVVNRQILLYNDNNASAYTQQSLKVTGKVTDSAGGTLPGVSVVVKGTTNGTITGMDGTYVLGNVPVNAILQFSFVGMKTQEVAVTGKTSINIVLEEEAIGIDEVVAIGYGVQKKKLNTGATIQVSGDNLQKMNTVSALGALQSQSPGVSITQSSGMPGEGFKVNIRGIGTTGNSSPLYVIDGVAGGDINSLNPSDIESVDVLKDAASAAIYGARAANGVILVTTRQGHAGKMQITYDGYYGVQNAYKLAPLTTAKEYMTILNEINFNEGLAAYDWKTMMPDIYNKVNSGWEGTNWLKEIRNKDAVIQNHSINVVGGTEMSKFSMGFSVSTQDGIFGSPVQPYFKRYTARINSEHVLYKGNHGFDVIKLGENLNFNFNTRQGIGIGNIYWNDVHNMLVGCPLMPIYDAEGNYWAKDDNTSSGLVNLNPDLANPIASMVYNRGQNLSKNYALNANAYIEIQPIKNLIYKSSFGYKMSASSYRQYVPTYELSQSALNSDEKVQQSLSAGYGWTWENTLAYSFKVNEHSFNTLIGQSLEKWGLGENLDVTGTPSLFDDFEHAWISNANQTYKSGVTTYKGKPWGEGGIESFFGRINYNYKETYMASATVRADGSSNFARGHRWGYFPSMSAGWVISNESFMESTKNILNFMKLRVSWGQNGNANIDNFQYLATVAFDQTAAYSFGNTKTTQSTGGYAEILPNKDVSWETSEQLDFGFDSRFLNSRLGVSFDLYKKTTKDWLVKAPILASYGTNAPWVNGGDVENKGVELALNWNDHVGDFTYGANLNLAYNKNEVTRIANGEGIIHGEANILSQGTTEMYRAQVGYPIGYFWGYKTAGVFQNAEQIKSTKAFLQKNPQPGDLIFVDTDGNGVINNKDKCEIGNPHPDFILGLNLNLGYKGFDLNVSANGAFGQQIAKSYRSFVDGKTQNYTTDIFARWHGEGTSNKLPRLSSGADTNWQEISDIYIENGDYLKIQNITLGYDFKKLFSKLPFAQTRLYITAQNVYTFTKYSGMDPEIGYSPTVKNAFTGDDVSQDWVKGIDLGFYPSPRTIMIGINLKF